MYYFYLVCMVCLLCRSAMILGSLHSLLAPFSVVFLCARGAPHPNCADCLERSFVQWNYHTKKENGLPTPHPKDILDIFHEISNFNIFHFYKFCLE